MGAAEKMRPLWSKEECTLCGRTGYATRMEPKPVSEPYICGECEAIQTAEERAEAQIGKLERKVEELEAENKRLRRENDARIEQKHFGELTDRVAAIEEAMKK